MKPPSVCGPPSEDHSVAHILGCICIKNCIPGVTPTSICHYLLAASYFSRVFSLAQQQSLLKPTRPPAFPGLLTPPAPGPRFPLSPRARVAWAMTATSPLPTARLPCPSLTLSGLPGTSPIPARPILCPAFTPSQTPIPSPPPTLFTLS